MTRLFRAAVMLSALAWASGAFAQMGLGGRGGPPDQLLPAMGGGGGGQFFARCAPTDVLHGFDLTTGDDVDSITPVCQDLSAGNEFPEYRTYYKKFGGERGSSTPAGMLRCPKSAPVVVGLEVGYEGQQTVIINNIHLYCGSFGPNQPLTSYPSAAWDGPVLGRTEGGFLTPSQKLPLGHGLQTCPPGLVPVGINGRSGYWLDAVGLICGSPPPLRHLQAKTPVGSIGRRGAGGGTPGPAMSLCERAKDARARHSPVAATLEAQCAAHPEGISSIGKVDAGPAVPRDPAIHTICDAARDALSRQSPAAPNLVRQCRALGGVANAVASNAELETVAVRGEGLSANDEFVTQILGRITEPNARRGFFIGLGAWGANTAPGPGKQRFHDALIAAEQRGFELAAAYALPHNKYAALLNVGAVINAADAEVAAARSADTDGFFWLGFDIASGLFGDPAAGSQGQKVFGAEAGAIRESLNAAGQRGFNSSMQLHLSRSYR